MEDYKKKYEAAIKAAKKYQGAHIILTEDVIEEMFPELRDSEDERIRKEIIDIINSYDVAHLKATGLPSRIPEYISWLEKQGKPTDINPSEFDLQLNRLLKEFESLPKEELVNSLSFYLNGVQNDSTYKEEKQGDTSSWGLIDDIKIDNICQLIQGHMKAMPDTAKVHFVKFLKSLRERFTQKKCEWNKEDEERLRDTINTLVVYKENTNVRCSQKALSDCIANIDWLKSLKDRIQLKL